MQSFLPPLQLKIPVACERMKIHWRAKTWVFATVMRGVRIDVGPYYWSGTDYMLQHHYNDACR